MSRTITLVPQRSVPSMLTRVGQAIRQAIRSYTVQGSLKDPAFARLFGSGSVAAGMPVTYESAFTFSAVYDAVNQISSDVAKLPLNLLKRREDGGSDHYVDAKLYRLLKDEPNPEMGSMVFRRTVQAHALTCKGGFAEIERDGNGRPVGFWVLTPDRVEMFRDERRGDDGRVRLGPLRYRIDGGPTVLEDRNVIHIEGLGYDGYEGYPLITQARQAIGLALAAEKFGSSFFANGSTFGGILTTEQDFDPASEDAKDVREQIEKWHASAEKAHRLLVMGGGFKFHATGVDPEKSQLNDLRDKQIEETARFFNMPLHKLKSLLRATNNNIEQQDLEYYKGPIVNWITLWEQELNRKCISPLESRQQYIKHNAKAFLRADVAGRTALYSALLDRGVYCADDVLALEDENPQPNGQGKMFLVQGAMVPKDKIQALADATIEKAKRPKTQPAAPAAPAADPTTDKRTAAAEALAEEARQLAQQEREARIAAEASGTASAAELERLRASEQALIVRAAQLELIAEDLRREQQTAIEARQRLEAELLDAQQARDAATARATDASARAERADSAQAEAEHRAATATEASVRASSQAEAAERWADEARAASETAGADREASDAARAIAEATASEARATADRLDAERAAIAQEAAALRTSAEQAQAEAERRDADARVEITAARARIAEIETALDVSTAARATAGTTATEAIAQAQAERAALAGELAEARAAAATDQQRATEAAAALASAREQLGTLETALTSTCGSHDAAVTALQATITALERQAAEVRERAEAQEARATSLTETVAEREAEIRTVQQADTEAMAGVIAAHRALVVDIMRRMVERESDRARRAQANPEKFRTWLATFYDGHADLMRAALLPAVRVHLAFIRSVDDPIETTRRLVEAHVEESLRQLRVVLDGDAEDLAASVSALLYRWDQERTTTIADRLMERELTYARR